MIETKTTQSDIDIQAALRQVLTSAEYAPLTHDRRHVEIAVQDGVVTVSGHVKTPQTVLYLRNRAATIPGVKAVQIENLFDDETIRREVGKVIPYGVQVRVEYGTVILTGQIPQDTSVEELVKRVALVPGVHRVITTF
ncbi:MAG: hypothetical protein CUN56_05515 [Phototrophicales bacterium]|nr:MAG: hypothetical protein CUN56_05515 [Phototrophicales bacterium]RMG74738.1 MAG: BON domain-containing protein [Chloroflexota bacterium]